MTPRSLLVLPLAGLVALLAVCVPAVAGDDHAAHAVAGGRLRSEQAYTVPAVTVLRADGRRLALTEALDDGRPVVLNFIYTSCNAICPVTSQVFAEVRERLGAARERINMVSISIDPEQDTPARLRDYAHRFGAAGEWAHYTSSAADAVAIQRAFGAWRGDKMNHQPATYLRRAPGQPWVRLDGFFGPTALVGEIRQALSLAAAPDTCAGAGRALSMSPAGLPAGPNGKCPS